MKPMRERNQVAVAIWGTVLAAVLVLVAVNLDKLPFVNPSNTYYADFANADGLASGDDVRVLGISVGTVQSVRVQGDHVHVEFTVQSGLKLGNQSDASIEVATVLGNLYLQVESAGTGTLAEGATIPRARTTVPYSLLGAFNAFGKFSRKTQLPVLRKSLATLAKTISGISPTDARAALHGLSDVASTLAAKQDEVSSVLTSANGIVKTLNHNSTALVGLLMQGDQFLQLVESRHQLIGQLLTDTARLGTELQQSIRSDGSQLRPLLRNLDQVTAVLAREHEQLQRAVVNLGQFSVNVTNATGSGPWIDLLSPTAVVPDDQIVGCGPDPAAQRKVCGK